MKEVYFGGRTHPPKCDCRFFLQVFAGICSTTMLPVHIVYIFYLCFIQINFFPTVHV